MTTAPRTMHGDDEGRPAAALFATLGLVFET